MLPLPPGLGIPLIGIACALIASVERIRGIPIPRFRTSSVLKRESVYLAVPVVIAVMMVLGIFLPLKCAHCNPRVFKLMMVLTGAGAVGWIVFGLLSLVLGIGSLLRRLYVWLRLV